ncbi:hypothetical protein PUR71_25640 [Streptomyces sp. SP17BM10]|uniref:hypothetical protein n=1 Tax=Streptomyces sp. SP17BM10 TaxID=3002530 RepID=UPI002E778147|nr:hypothetical protein [Streptomyces sp. SP17BM10]MEE1786257.1 hypothetical protein [Streptomyces sp. SP17BM10]
MATHSANRDPRLLRWLRVREFAVPPTMIESATARRRTGDWAGACAAARLDVDLDLKAAARAHGRALVEQLRAELRRLAPDLLRWHLPRTAPDGLLRPGLTVPLARYDGIGRDVRSPVHLVVRTPPAWADGGQRISIALWSDGADAGRHPHPRPSRRYRLDLHRHLWDADRAGELGARGGEGAAHPAVPPGLPCAVDRWAAEARVLLAADGLPEGPVAVRLGGRHRLVLGADGTPAPGVTDGLPVLPDAATWIPPDVELLRAGLIEPDRLHPLVAAALAPGRVPAARVRPPDGPRFVDCRGSRHRIGLVDGVLAALDHGPEELRREELLVALGGPPLPCLRAIDLTHKRPTALGGVRELLDHGDTAGALAVVEELLGPAAVLRDGPLRDELEAAAQRRIAYGLYRAGLVGAHFPTPCSRDRRPRARRTF